ncbi:MAG: hypothetical protein IJW66_00045 [Clostridia bacterium]|nr:hypothetical protein [Clostridia bacterium]
MPGGDRIGEAIRDGHTLDEILILLSEMSEKWRRGEEKLSKINSYGRIARAEQQSVASAIALLFESGYNVTKFYSLRHKLGILDGEPGALLSEMRCIVDLEIENSKRLIELCKRDGRLGYHSEANGYKFFPEKLLWRIEMLENLLSTEFPYVEERIERGEYPLEFYRAEGEGLSSYTICESDIEKATWVAFDGKSKYTYFSAAERDGEVLIRLRMLDGMDDRLLIKPEMHLFMPTTEYELCGGKLVLKPNPYTSFVEEKLAELRSKLSVDYRETDGCAEYTLSFRRADFDMKPSEPFRLAITRYGKHPDILKTGERRFFSIIDDDYSPDEYFFFIK